MAAPELGQQAEVLHQLQDIFNQQDVGRKGYLTEDEWTAACQQFDSEQSQEVASESFRRLDSDGEGKLDYLSLLNSFQAQLNDSGTDAVHLLLNMISNPPASQRNANIAAKGRRKGTRRKGTKKGSKRTGRRAKAVRSPRRAVKSGVKKGRRRSTASVKRKKRSADAAAGSAGAFDEELSMSLTLPQTDAEQTGDAELPTMLPPPEPGPDDEPPNELAAASMPSDYRVWGPPSSWKPATLQQWKNAELKSSWLPKLEAYDTAAAMQRISPGKLKKAGFKLLKTRKAVMKKVKRLRELEAELNPSSPVKASDHIPATVEEELSRDMMELRAAAELFTQEVALPDLRPPPVPPAGFDEQGADPVAGHGAPAKRLKRGRAKRGKGVKKAGTKGRKGRKLGTRRKKKGRRSNAASTVGSQVDHFALSPPHESARSSDPIGISSISEVVNWTSTEINEWARSFMKPKSARTFTSKVSTGLELLGLNAKSIRRLKLMKTKAGRKKILDHLELLKAADGAGPPAGPGTNAARDGGDLSPEIQELPADGESVEAPAHVAQAIQVQPDRFDINSPIKAPSGEDFLSLSPQSPSPHRRAGAHPDQLPLPHRADDPGAQTQPLFGSANKSVMADPELQGDEQEPPPLPIPHDMGGQNALNGAEEQEDQGQGPAPAALEQEEPLLEDIFQSQELQNIFRMFATMDVEQKGYLERDQWIDCCRKLFAAGNENYIQDSFERLRHAPGKLDYARVLMSIQEQVTASHDAPEGELNALDIFTNLIQGDSIQYEEDMDLNYGEQPMLTGLEVFDQLKMLNPHVNEDEFKDNTGSEWDMDKLYEELQVYHDYGLEQENYQDVPLDPRELEALDAEAERLLGEHPGDYPYTYEAFKAKVSELMPGYGDEAYRELWDGLPESESGTVTHQVVKDMIIQFISQHESAMEMPVLDQSSDEGRDPPAHFQGRDRPAEGNILGSYGAYPEPTESMIDSTERMQAAEDHAREIMDSMELPVERHEV